jgi:hypothetical protein
MLDSHPQLAMPPETAFLPEVLARLPALGSHQLADLIVGFPTWPDFHLDAAGLRLAYRVLRGGR